MSPYEQYLPALVLETLNLTAHTKFSSPIYTTRTIRPYWSGPAVSKLYSITTRACIDDAREWIKGSIGLENKLEEWPDHDRKFLFLFQLCVCCMQSLRKYTWQPQNGLTAHSYSPRPWAVKSFSCTRVYFLSVVVAICVYCMESLKKYTWQSENDLTTYWLYVCTGE